VYINVGWDPSDSTDPDETEEQVEFIIDSSGFTNIYSPFLGLCLANVEDVDETKPAMAELQDALNQLGIVFVVTVSPRGTLFAHSTQGIDRDTLKALARYAK